MSALSASEERDRRLMAMALEAARAAAAAGEAPIGAMLYDPERDAVIARAHNQPIGLCDPSAHAEILALRAGAAARGNYRLNGLWLYVTLEPCAMCAGAISHARIARLIYGADDPKGGALGGGPRFFEQPTCHWRPEITAGIMVDDSADLLRRFFQERRSRGKGKTGGARQG